MNMLYRLLGYGKSKNNKAENIKTNVGFSGGNYQIKSKNNNLTVDNTKIHKKKENLYSEYSDNENIQSDKGKSRSL